MRRYCCYQGAAWGKPRIPTEKKRKKGLALRRSTCSLPPPNELVSPPPIDRRLSRLQIDDFPPEFASLKERNWEGIVCGASHALIPRQSQSDECVDNIREALPDR